MLKRAGPLVMEDDSPHPALNEPGSPAQLATSSAVNSLSAGICNGLQSECNAWENNSAAQPNGVRQHAQLRLNRCRVDYERLKSTSTQTDPEVARTGKEIRKLMRRMYGEPDQDYEDWQIVVLSDMDSG
jgi:hypothetical protein